MVPHTRLASLILVVTCMAGCSGGDPAKPAASSVPLNPKEAHDSITAADLLRHITTLASDEFEGRAVASKGEELTVAYLQEAFRKAGLAPGNPNGTYVQDVPLVGVTSTFTGQLAAGGRPVALKPIAEYFVISRRLEPEVVVPDSEVVFVGYGVKAPEYGWDDFKGLDVKGKTLVFLINDPPLPDPADASRLDPKMFGGRAMTYYGRYTYKYELASELGAAAALIIHETGPAGYPYEVLSGSLTLENFELRRPDRNAGRVAVEGWLTEDAGRRFLKQAGQDFDALKQAALSKDFKPVPLRARVRFDVRNALRDVNTRNVIAKVEGSDPALKSEYVLYTAHWDHVGRDTSLAGDQIYNGAVDNAAGVAALLELGEAFAKLPAKPKRTTLFLSVTTEEKGILGAKYYAENPLYPLDKTLANLNMDGMNQWGRTRDVTIIGFGNSTIDDVAAAVAKDQGRVLKPDPEPEKGYFYRSDHFELAKVGVPAFYPDNGTEYIGKPEGYGQQKRDEYVAHDYHKVTDEVKPDWDLSGAADDTRFLFEVGYRIAQGTTWPEWSATSEFRAAREASLGGRAGPDRR